VARAMSRSPSDRYPSARHLSMELRHWLEQPEARALIESPASVRRRHLTLIGLGVGAAAIAAVLQAWQPWASDTAPADEVPVAAAPVPVATTAPVPDTVASAATAAVDAASAVTAEAPTDVPAPAPVEEVTKPKPATATAKDRKQRPTVTAPVAVEPEPVVPLPTGTVQLAISPWGQIEVDGSYVGLAPPMNRLSLPGGSHTITIRNGDFPPLVKQVTVSADQPVVIKHRFEQ
jgi:eukaryotic-like serine/threonine-protein kinase